MPVRESIAIDKTFVHKEKQENILINNLRAEIPLLLEADLFEKELLPLFRGSDLRMLKESYFPIDLSVNRLPFSQATGEHYLYRQVLPFITEKKLAEKRKTIPGGSWESLKNYYINAEEENTLVLSRAVKELDQIVILKLLDERDRLMTDNDKSYLSDILFRSGLIVQEDVFYANMVVNLNHEFFFEHYNEHVPGMMVIEAMRQFGLASCHKYGNVPAADYQIMMSHLDICFNNYVDYHFPIKLTGTLPEKKTTASGMWKNVILDFHVYQHSAEAANIKFNGRSIKKEIFGRLRQKQLYEMVQHYRFVPHHDDIRKHKFCLRNMRTQEYINGALNEISTRGFSMEILLNENYISEDRHEFLFSFENRYFIHGECDLIESRESDETLLLDFLFSGLPQEDYDNLIKSIKLYTRAIEYREFF